MSYERRLAAELRYRNIPDTEIADILAEVRDHLPAGAIPEEEFGPPAEYAAQFPARRAKAPAPMLAAIILALAYTVFAFSAKPLLDLDLRDYVGPVRLWPAAAILGIGTLTAFLLATLRRPPRVHD